MCAVFFPVVRVCACHCVDICVFLLLRSDFVFASWPFSLCVFVSRAWAWAWAWSGSRRCPMRWPATWLPLPLPLPPKPHRTKPPPPSLVGHTCLSAHVPHLRSTRASSRYVCRKPRAKKTHSHNRRNSGSGFRLACHDCFIAPAPPVPAPSFAPPLPRAQVRKRSVSDPHSLAGFISGVVPAAAGAHKGSASAWKPANEPLPVRQSPPVRPLALSPLSPELSRCPVRNHRSLSLTRIPFLLSPPLRQSSCGSPLPPLRQSSRGVDFVSAGCTYRAPCSSSSLLSLVKL